MSDEPAKEPGFYPVEGDALTGCYWDGLQWTARYAKRTSEDEEWVPLEVHEEPAGKDPAEEDPDPVSGPEIGLEQFLGVTGLIMLSAGVFAGVAFLWSGMSAAIQGLIVLVAAGGLYGLAFLVRRAVFRARSARAVVAAQVILVLLVTGATLAVSGAAGVMTQSALVAASVAVPAAIGAMWIRPGWPATLLIYGAGVFFSFTFSQQFAAPERGYGSAVLAAATFGTASIIYAAATLKKWLPGESVSWILNALLFVLPTSAILLVRSTRFDGILFPMAAMYVFAVIAFAIWLIRGRRSEAAGVIMLINAAMGLIGLAVVIFSTSLMDIVNMATVLTVIGALMLGVSAFLTVRRLRKSDTTPTTDDPEVSQPEDAPFLTPSTIPDTYQGGEQ